MDTISVMTLKKSRDVGIAGESSARRDPLAHQSLPHP